MDLGRGMVTCLVLAGVVVAGCSGGGDSGSSAPTPSSTESTPAAEGTCTGEALICARYQVEACSYRSSVCTSIGQSCTDRYASSPDVEKGCAAHTSETACVDAIGCTWNAKDGRTATAEYGACAGAAVPCEDIKDETECARQPGAGQALSCRWSTLPPEGCRPEAETTCSTFTVSGPPTGTDALPLHPGRAKNACLARKGCTWQPN